MFDHQPCILILQSLYMLGTLVSMLLSVCPFLANGTVLAQAQVNCWPNLPWMDVFVNSPG